jgi:hypothetical protein
MRHLGWSILIGCLLLPCPLAAGEEIKPSNLVKLNTEADETDPFPLPDGITLLYASNAKGKFEILLSRRSGPKDAWPAGKVFLPSTEGEVRTPFFHKGTTMVYFASAAVADPNLADMKNFDILRKLEQTAPVPLQGISTPEDEMAPWITPSGHEFYFSRMTRKGWLLYQADGPKPGPIGNARPAGLPPGFYHATLTPSGLLMYVQGPAAGAEEKSALYRCRRTKLGAAWSKPELLSGLSHSQGKRGDLAPSLNAEGTRLYFSSDRPGGKGGLDLWSVLTAQLK